MRWALKDSFGKVFRWRFSSEHHANHFKYLMGRSDWKAFRIK